MRIDWHCVCGDAESSHSSRSDGEHCHGHCQRTEKDCQGKGYRPIPHTLRTAAFSAILSEAEQRFLPRAYTCDLSTDYQSLVGQGGLLLPDGGYTGRFIWVLRTNGTEFYRLDDQDALSLQHSRVAFEYWTDATQGHAENLCFAWDGAMLHQVSRDWALGAFDEAIESVAPSGWAQVEA